MGVKQMSLIVASEEALVLAARERTKLIYVENDLYHQNEQGINRCLTAQGYRKLEEPGKKGHFFVCADIPLVRLDIYDPLNIL